MNNLTILDEKCPPGWSLFIDTCYTYVAAPMTFYEARDFCRSDNATMPFIRGPTDTLWLFLQRQMRHLRYPEKVWVQDYSYLEKCTSFIYRNTEIDDCDTKRGFLCEIDPKVSDFWPHFQVYLQLFNTFSYFFNSGWDCFKHTNGYRGHRRDQRLFASFLATDCVRILLVFEITPSSRPTIGTTKQHTTEFAKLEQYWSTGIDTTTKLCRNF